MNNKLERSLSLDSGQINWGRDYTFTLKFGVTLFAEFEKRLPSNLSFLHFVQALFIQHSVSPIDRNVG
jgi:hypothetical protein